MNGIARVRMSSNRTEAKRSKEWIAIAGLAVGCLSMLPAGAVIDCSRVTSNADRLVCSNDRLAAAEEGMARAYRDALRRGVEPQKLRETQGAWKAGVRDRCNDAACLLRAYDGRTAELDGY
jgi:uncharacterized protein